MRPPEELKQKLEPISLAASASGCFAILSCFTILGCFAILSCFTILGCFAILGCCAGSFLPAQAHGKETNSQAELKPKLLGEFKSKSPVALKSKLQAVSLSKSQVQFEPNSKTSIRSPETRNLAQFHTTRREFKEAIVLWSKLADQKPDAFAEANLGWSYLQMGEKEKAKKHISRSIELNPRTIEGYRYLGYYLMAEGKVPEAVKAFRKSMSFDPHHKCNCGDLEKLVLSKSPNRKP